MCPWTELRRTQGGSMSAETFEQIRPYLQQAEAVDLTGGGEPLMNPRLLDMVRAVKEAGCRVGFSTNGKRLVPELAQKLLDLELDWLSFSVDAASKGLYERIRQGASFDTIVANISYLRDLKIKRASEHPKMMMVFVMMNTAGQDGISNVEDLPDFVELAHRLGVEQVIAKNLDVIMKEKDDQRRVFKHEGDAAPEVEKVLAEAQRRAARLGVSLRSYQLHPQEQTICEHDPLKSLFINWRGDISPCITLSYSEERFFNGQRVFSECQRFGNIQDQSLEEIWNNPAYRHFRAAFENRIQAERGYLVDALLGVRDDQESALPQAPESCQTCYYLYGI